MAEEKKLNVEQERIIAAKGKTIVSASAGAGKTHVMIEKICSGLEDGSADLDSLLAITYTKKAAAQMKDRLQKKLRLRIEELSAEKEKNGEKISRLKEQLFKSTYADIGTMHSFCAKLIRTYYYALDEEGLDSSFTISDEKDGAMKALSEKVLDELFEDMYDDGKFKDIVDKFWTGRSDSTLRKIVLNGYKELRVIPDYRARLSGYESIYDEDGFNKVCEEIVRQNKFYFEFYLPDIQNAIDFANSEKKAFSSKKKRLKYVEFLENVKSNINAIVNFNGDISTLPKKAVDLSKPKKDKNMPREETEFNDKVDKLFGSNSTYRTKWSNVFRFITKRDDELKNFIDSRSVASSIYNLILEYDRRLSERKRVENILDYGDLEHFTLEIIGNTEGSELRKEILEEIHSTYTDIYVDEYQDVNPVQEAILECLTDDRTQVFYVGDRKQAIYEFRGSNSEFFSKKVDEYTTIGGKDFHALSLSKNFRSAENIVFAVNEMFGGTSGKDSDDKTYAAMNKGICDVDYVSGDMMVYGGGFDSSARGDVEIDYFKDDFSPDDDENALDADSYEDDSDENDPQSESSDEKERLPVYSVMKDVERKEKKGFYNAQGNAVAAVIDDVLFDSEKKERKKIYDKDKKCCRYVEYGDICVLVRKGNNKDIRALTNYLIKMNYPVAGVKSGNILKRSEIRLILDILSYIDNQKQDDKLCAFLLSPVCGFTDEELAKIRVRDCDAHSFRERVEKYGKEEEDELAEKINFAFAKIKEYRDLADALSVDTLIDVICADAGWNLAYEKDGGELKKCVSALRRAVKQPGGDMSLSAFLRYVNSEDTKIDAPDMADSDCIHIMTIHSAKGLEFPVVIVSNVVKWFKGKNSGDSSVTFDAEWGFAPKYSKSSDTKGKDTVLSVMLGRKKKEEEIKNELNIFYVACTRAKNSLHIMKSTNGKPFSIQDTFTANSYAELVDFDSLTGYDDKFGFGESGGIEKKTGRKINYAIVNKKSISHAFEESDKEGETDMGLYENLRSKHAVYETFLERPRLPMAAAVTYLPKRNTPKGAAEAMSDEDTGMSEILDETNPEIGTAYHKYLEVCDLTKKDRAGIETEMNEKLDEETRARLSVDKLEKILAMKAFSSLPQKYYRERKFMCLMSAKDVFNVNSDDEIRVDGVIDFLAIDGDHARILDYKFSEKTRADLVDTYSNQLRIYREAVAKICGIPKENISTTLINIDRLEEVLVEFEN